MASVFISYRREDSGAEAGRLYDRLIAHFTDSDVFFDIDMIRPGDDFVDVLQKKILNADVMLVVIGRSWHSAKDGARKIRLKDPKDLVRLEILAAMEKRVAIVPVLVGGATMPLASQLPPDLRSLTRLQAFELPNAGFHQATSRLIQEIERLAKQKAEAARRAEEERLAKERAEVAERAEQERLAKEKTEAATRAEQDKLAREKEEARRAEQERLALRAKAPVAEAGASRPSAAGPQLQSPRPAPARHVSSATAVNPIDGLTYLWVPPRANDNSGDNTIGSTFDSGFWISQGPISVRAFAEYCRTTGHEMPSPAPFSNPGWQDPESSMVCVTWNEAAKYCAWAGGRLPTEPEWEFAMKSSGLLALAATGDTSLVLQGDVLYVKSKWEGPLYFPNYKIVVDPDGSVRGDITGKEVTILGKVVGHTRGTDLIQVRSVGGQYGDMTAARVLIEDGAYFEGAVKLLRPSPAGGESIGSPAHLRIDPSITEWCADSFRDDPKAAEDDLRVTRGESRRTEAAYWARGRAGLGALNRTATVGFPLRVGQGRTLFVG